MPTPTTVELITGVKEYPIPKQYIPGGMFGPDRLRSDVWSKVLHTTPSRGGPSLIVQTYVEEDVSPEVNAAATNAHPALVKGMRRVGEELKKSVRANFIAKSGEYQNSETTRMLKGGKPALVETGKLSQAMQRSDGVTVVDAGAGGVTLRVSWEIPESGGTGVRPQNRANNSFEYLWSHEYGADMERIATKDREIEKRFWSLQPRPFFLEGISKGRDEALAALSGEVAGGVGSLHAHKVPPAKGFGVRLLPMYAPIPNRVRSLGMYFAPPSKMYAYVGAAADIMGAWSGAFTEAAIFGYGRQMFWGQFGATKKTVRRNVRRRIWA